MGKYGEKQSQRRISWENHEFYPLDFEWEKTFFINIGIYPRVFGYMDVENPLV